MKAGIVRSIPLLACLVAASTWSTLGGNSVRARARAASQSVSFGVMVDLHIYGARLGTSGAAYEQYLYGDPKLVKESEAILEAAAEGMVQAGVQFVIIPGDLTKEGELVDHVLAAQHLQKLEQRGIQVFVVPGNHDINNPNALCYVGDGTRPVPNTSPEAFRAIYQRFGYGEAIAHDSGSLSYVAEPVPGLWLLAIDSCKYQDARLVSGRISPQTMAWIQATLQQAQARGKQVIAFMHHGVNQHFLPEPLLFPDYLVDDWQLVSAQLAEGGLKVVFTGHYHSQDAAYPVDENLQPQQTLCDVETSSLAQYPCAYRIVTIYGDMLNIRSQRVTEIKADTDGLPFQEYADAFLRFYMEPQVVQRLAALLQFSPEEARELAPIVIDALVANYAGDEAPSAETWQIIEGLLSSPDPRRQQLGQLLAGIWTDLWPADNELQIPFAEDGNSVGRPGGPVGPPGTPPPNGDDNWGNPSGLR